MALEITKQTIEVETCAGSASAQTLARAETLVPGAGREAIEVLLAEAEVSVLSAQAQAGRIVAEAEVRTQAAYRQGDETAPRALSARTGLSRTFEIEGVEPQMAAEVCARVEHVEAKYENGRMVFLVTVDMTARATGLRSVEVLTGVTGLEDVQQDLREICSEKTAAQTKIQTKTKNIRSTLEAGFVPRKTTHSAISPAITVIIYAAKTPLYSFSINYLSVRSVSTTVFVARFIFTVLNSYAPRVNSFSKPIAGSVSTVLRASAVGLKRRITESSLFSAFLNTASVITSSESLANAGIVSSFSFSQPIGKNERAIGFSARAIASRSAFA